MESVLKQLESRIDDFIEAHEVAQARVAELEARVAELEQQAEEGAGAGERVLALESQRDDLAERLKRVLELIDGALAKGGSEEK